MQYDKTVGNVNIKVNTTRLDRNTMEAQKLLNIQVVEDSNNLIPFQQGASRGSVRYPEGLYGGVISWGKKDTPYAHYQYEGELYLTKDGRSYAHKGEQKYPTGIPLIQHAAGTTDHWFEHAKEQNLKHWIDLVRRTAGKG